LREIGLVKIIHDAVFNFLLEGNSVAGKALYLIPPGGLAQLLRTGCRFEIRSRPAGFSHKDGEVGAGRRGGEQSKTDEFVSK
jgi:hypothetical protein